MATWLGLTEDVRALFLDAQGPVFDRAYAGAVARHWRAVEANRTHGWPEATSDGTYACADGYVIKVTPFAALPNKHAPKGTRRLLPTTLAGP